MKEGRRRPACVLRLLVFPVFTPGSFLMRAGFIAVVFFIVQLLGMRDAMSLLSGTLPEGGASWEGAALGCMVYFFAYFGFVLVVPVLVIAAPVFHLLLKLHGARRRIPPEPDGTCQRGPGAVQCGQMLKGS